ncbi:MAG: large conductance mechanosensitive channel protein MscL [Acutalibacteraceae bacterium]|nr:large conductance mechanosensitive channel protein MscL [Acutalibacteraceae bacterium]
MKENKAVQKTTGFFKEFKDFISKGNVIDLAVGVIIGGAFSGIVNNLVTNIVTPAISLLTGKVSFTDLFIALDGGEYSTLAAAQEAGAATLNYGLFIQAVIDFIITAFVIFLLVKGINKIRSLGKKAEEVVEAAPTTKVCPFCKTEINIEATRCPNCTSEVE